jgi:uncharacterized protein YfdQ (DUF2303 family)
MIHDLYRETDAAPEALAAAQATALAAAQAEPVFRDAAAGVAYFRDGGRVDWSAHLPRPARQSGTAYLANPGSFAEYVLRHSTPETVIFADKADGVLVAVFNGPPATSQDDARQVAGHGDWRARLDLVDGADWVEWRALDRSVVPQREFGEHVDGLAHTMVEPDGATMIEIATTLTSKTKLDFASRVNLGNGEVSFKAEEETTSRAGKTGNVEIPTQFMFRVPLWEGTDPVDIVARLRFRAGREDGVMMGYRIVRKAEAVERAFAGVVELIADTLGDGIPIYHGTAPAPQR